MALALHNGLLKMSSEKDRKIIWDVVANAKTNERFLLIISASGHPDKVHRTDCTKLGTYDNINQIEFAHSHA